MNKSIIFFDSTTNLINPNDDAFSDKKLVELFIAKDKSIDEVLTKTVLDNLLNDEFINIIIPVCFGDILSDFIGLRLATHIRCTPGVNRHANIFLYSYTKIQDYFSNECFNIVRTKGVFLIDYNVETIIKSLQEDKKHFTKESLVNQVKKLKIDVPLNYEDNHSIANEWSIYRWANTIKANDNSIVNIESKLDNTLYYKYLKTIYPVSDFDTLNSDELQLNFEGKPTILYIDDEAEKGWKEIFEKIIIDENDIEFIHLDDEFNEKTKTEIIEISLNEVIKENVDLVILDFRLHKEDFEEIPIQDVTGYQILKKIKEHNKGIQVIVFSATNKIWNLKALQEAGADGFILKEAPENSNDSSFTKRSIEEMLQTLNYTLGCSFLKDFYKNLEDLKNELIPRKKYKKSSNPLPVEFVDEVLKWVEMSFNILSNGLSEINKTSAFIMLFSVLENLSNRVIDVENPIRIDESYDQSHFEYEFRKEQKKLRNYKQNELGVYIDSGQPLRTIKGGIPWTQKIMNTLYNINSGVMNNEELNALVKKRNDIIHANSTTGDKVNIDIESIIFLNSLIYKGLLSVT